MKINFKRIPHKWTFTFEASIGHSNYTAHIKRLFIPYPRIVHIEEDGVPSFQMKEQTLLKRYLLKLLFLPFTWYLIKRKSTYTILEQEEDVGSIEFILSWKEHKYLLDYKNTPYTMYEVIYKRHIRYYIFKDHNQVGAIEKDKVGYNGAHAYYGECSDDLPKQVILSFLLHLHVMKLRDIVMTYNAYSSSYTMYGWKLQNRNLDISIDHVELTKPKPKT